MKNLGVSGALAAVLLFAGCARLNPIRLYLESHLPAPRGPNLKITETLRMIPLEDGAGLFTAIYAAPKADNACLLVRIPLPQSLKYRLFREAFGHIWARRGYTVVIQNIRGFPPSTGDYEPFVNEREDGKVTLNWLNSEGLCSKGIYLWGGSYFGLTQWAIGDIHSGPKAIQIASPRLNEFFFPGGAFALSSALFWTARNYNVLPDAQDIKEAAALDPLTADERLLNRVVPYYRDWLMSRGSKQYWKAVFPNANNGMLGPVFLMGGWYDPFLPEMLKDFASLATRQSPTKLVIGPWAHAQAVRMADGFRPKDYRLESIERPLRWFKNLKNNHHDESIEIFLMGENRWITVDSFPPSDTKFLTWRLDFDKSTLDACNADTCRKAHYTAVRLSLDPTNPTPGIGGIELGENVGPLYQAQISERPDVLVLLSEPLDKPITVIGEPQLLGPLGSDNCRADLIATLVDRFPSGKSYLVTEGNQRIHSADQGEVDLKLRPTAHVFKRGHRFGIQLAPANYPRYDLPACTKHFSEAVLTMFSSPSQAWTLRLPLMHKGID